MAHDVFISYSSKDKAAADAVCAVLEGRGVRCWVAPRDILPGSEWGESIIDAIAGSRVMVLVFSANANASPQVRREVERAVNKGVTVVPLRIENVPLCKSLEYFVSTPHWMDAYTAPLEQHLARLAETVGALVRVPGGSGVAPAPGPTVQAAQVAAPVRRSRAPKAAAAVVVAGLAAALAVRTWVSPAPKNSTAGASDVFPAVSPAPRGAPDDSKTPAPAKPPAPASQPAPPPKAAPDREAERKAAAAADARLLQLQSITVIGKQSSCVLNGRRLTQGETLDGFRVERITADRVVVVKNGFRFELRPRASEAAQRPARATEDSQRIDRGGPRPPANAGPTVWTPSEVTRPGGGDDRPPPPGGGPPPRGPRPGRP